MKHEIEFYDRHGLMMHSNGYQSRACFGDTSRKSALKQSCQAVENWGFLYPLAKIVTLRTTGDGALFPVTSDIVNPHFDASLDRAQIHGDLTHG